MQQELFKLGTVELKKVWFHLNNCDGSRDGLQVKMKLNRTPKNSFVMGEWVHGFNADKGPCLTSSQMFLDPTENVAQQQAQCSAQQ